MKKLFLVPSLLLTAAIVLTACGAPDTTNDAFATCIANSGAHFYGAYWCPHCADQKKEFGDSKSLLPYVECDPNGANYDKADCDANQVTQYPTWVFADGTKKVGVQTFDDLSKATSCPLPGDESIMLKN